MNQHRQIFLYIALALILLVIMRMGCNRYTNESTPTIITKTDTMVVVKYDTLVYEKPKYIYKKQIDTMFVVVNEKDSITLPIEQRYYSKKDAYDIWVSGYEPNLDSVKIYPKTIWKSVKIETKETIEKTNVYATLGFNAFNGGFIPEVGVSISTKKKWLIGAKIGYYDKNLVYGATVGYKLNK